MYEHVQYDVSNMLLLFTSANKHVKYTTLVSDANPEELLLAKEYDPDAFAKLIMAATQLDIKQKLGGEHHLRDIVWNLLKKLNDRYDKRLANLKDNISINGAVNYLGISPYNFNTVGADEEGESRLQDLKFGDVKCNNMFKEAGFDSSFTIKNPWSDLGAQFFKNCVAPTKLEVYFAKGAGPKAKQSPCKGNLFESMTAMCKQEYDAKIKKKLAAEAILDFAADGTSSSKEGQVAEKVKEIEHAARAKKMEEIRKSSKESLEKVARNKMVHIAKAKAKG